MVDMYEEMRAALLKYGKISPDEEYSKREIQKLYMKYQFEMTRAAAAKPKPPKKKPKPEPKPHPSVKKTLREKIASPLLDKFESKLEEILKLQKQFDEMSKSSQDLFNELLQAQYPELAEVIRKLNSWIEEAIAKQVPYDEMNKEIDRRMKDIQKRFMKIERTFENLEPLSDELRNRAKSVIDELEQQKAVHDSLTTKLEQSTSEISDIFENEGEV